MNSFLSSCSCFLLHNSILLKVFIKFSISKKMTFFWINCVILDFFIEFLFIIQFFPLLSCSSRLEWKNKMNIKYLIVNLLVTTCNAATVMDPCFYYYGGWSFFWKWLLYGEREHTNKMSDQAREAPYRFESSSKIMVLNYWQLPLHIICVYSSAFICLRLCLDQIFGEKNKK